MAQNVQPQVFINYISQRKKIIVNRQNQPTQLILQTDYYLNETYNFQIVNAINQIVQFDNATTYQVYGSYIDAKKQMHILFYTPNFIIKDNILSFTINTYTSQYLAYIKTNRTPIDISIVAKKGNSSYMVLRDTALANPRAYLEGQAPTDIVYQNVFNANVPVTGAFGAGNNIDLAQDFEGQQIASFAFGDTLSTSNANQFVVGYNNTPDATKAFIVANSGNIFTVDYNGNVEAGDLDVGAISATSVTINGEPVEYLMDDKLEATSGWVNDTFETKTDAFNTTNTLNAKINNLSAANDGKFEATSAWANDTFETKTAATESYNALSQDISDLSAEAYQNFELKTDATDKFNTLTGQTDYLSGAIDEHTTSIGELNTAVGSKANKTDLDELSGKFEAVEADYVTSGVLEAKTSSFITESDLNDYATKQYVTDATSAFITIDDVPTGTLYGTGFGLAASGDANNVFYLTAAVSDIDGYDTLALKSEITSFITEDALTDYATKQYVIDATSAFITEDALTSLATKEEVQTVDDKLSGYATKETVQGIDDRLTAVENAGYITESDLTDYATKQYVTDATSAFITIEDVPPGSVYTTGFGLAASGDANNIFYLTGTVLSGGDHISIENNVVSLTGDVGKTYTGGEGIEVDNTNNIISLSATIPSIDGLATEAYVTGAIEAATSGLATNSDLQIVSSAIPTDYLTAISLSIGEYSGEETSLDFMPDDFEWDSGSIKLNRQNIVEPYQIEDFVTSSDVQDIVTGYGYQTAAQVSAIASGYAGGGGLTSAEVSAIITGYNYITGITVKNSDYADTPVTYTTNTLEITDSDSRSQCLTISQGNGGPVLIMFHGINFGDEYDHYVTETNLYFASDFVLDSGDGWAELQLANPIPLSTSQLTNDSEYATSANVSSIITGYGYQTAAQVSAIASGYAGTGGLTSAEVSAIVTGYNYITGITFKEEIDDETVSYTGTTFEIKQDGNPKCIELDYDSYNDIITLYYRGITIDGNDYSGNYTNYLQARMLSFSDDFKISIGDYDDHSISLAHPIPLSTSQLTNDSGYATSAVVSAIVTGYTPAQKTKLSEFNNDVGFITINDISNTGITSAQVSGIVEGYGYQTAAQVSAIVTGYNYITGITISDSSNDCFYTEDNVHFWFSGPRLMGANNFDSNDSCLIFDDNFTLQQNDGYISIDLAHSIPTGVSQLTNDVGYATSSYVTGAIEAATSGLATKEELQAVDDRLTAVEADYTTSAQVSAIVEGYGYTTSAQVSAIASGYATGGGSTVELTNKQSNSFVTGTVIDYDPTIDVFKTHYTVTSDAISLSAVNVTTSQLSSNEIATFEEWAYTNDDFTTVNIGNGVTLVGDLPNQFLSAAYHVFTRRLVNVNGTINQYISFAYEVASAEDTHSEPEPQIDYASMPLTIAVHDDDAHLRILSEGDTNQLKMSYNKNNEGWTEMDVFEWDSGIQLANGDIIQLSGMGYDNYGETTFSNWDDTYFYIDGYDDDSKWEVYGNISSIFNNPDACYCNLFKGEMSKITGAYNLYLPSGTSNMQYYGLFDGCSDLVVGPKMINVCSTYNEETYEGFPDNCLKYMFRGCSNLQYIGANWDSWQDYQGYWDGIATDWTGDSGNGQDVPQQGTFVRTLTVPFEKNDPNDEYSTNRIPYNWTVVDLVNGVYYLDDGTGTPTNTVVTINSDGTINQ